MDESIKIDLKSEAAMMVKTGYVIRAGILLLVAVICVAGAIYFLSESVLAFIILCPFAVLFSVLFFKVIGKAFLKESIIVTKYDISIVRKFLFVRKTVTLKLDDLMSFGHDTEVSDYEELFDEGNIVLIRRSGPALRFGRGLPSWDVDEIICQIEGFAGTSLNRKKNNDVRHMPL